MVTHLHKFGEVNNKCTSHYYIDLAICASK